MSKHSPTRRKFLMHSGIMVSALTLMSDRVSADNNSINGIVDTHIHLWARDKKRFPYQPDSTYSPDYASTVEQWENDRIGTGISMAIFVQGAPYGDDPRFLFHCLEKAPQSFRGVCLVNPNVPEGSRILEENIQKNNHIVGVRLQTSWLWGIEWNSPHLEAFWKKVGELDKVLQIHLEPEFSWNFERMVKKYPETRVVIDHLGRPRSGDAVNYMQLLTTSRYPNVFMKLSSFSPESKQEPPHDKLKPLIDEIIRRFTPKRLVWGSNQYRGGMGSDAYKRLLNKALWFLDELSIDEKRQIFVDNPRRLYKM
ncbi:amidohydrolase family protein [Candidatus Latescibacterota bacterium]